MHAAEESSLSGGDPVDVLVVGDTVGVLTNTEQLSDDRFHFCPKLDDAVAWARRRRFEVICVVMSGLNGRPASGLAALRRVAEGSRIIVLAQMYEEASVRKLVRSVRDASRPVDDYVICPVDAGELLCGLRAGQDTAGPTSVSGLPATVEDRIRTLEKLATEDDLTGLKNRRYVREFLGQIISMARTEKRRVTLLVFDIDNFKHYNDKYGHPVGDNVLRQTAIMMRRCCRSHDVTGRIGGDEFAFIFWDCPGSPGKPAGDKTETGTSDRRLTETDHPTEAIFMAERFRKEISSAELSFLGAEGKGVLTISGGLASYPKDGSTVEELFSQADKALREAKKSGKNRISLVGKDASEGLAPPTA